MELRSFSPLRILHFSPDTLVLELLCLSEVSRDGGRGHPSSETVTGDPRGVVRVEEVETGQDDGRSQNELRVKLQRSRKSSTPQNNNKKTKTNHRLMKN